MEERIYLFVLDRGFVVIGRARLSDELLHHWRLSPGRAVRRWGTTRGLAELVDGPTAATVLDHPAPMLVPFRSVIKIIEVNEGKWAHHLTANESSGWRLAAT